MHISLVLAFFWRVKLRERLRGRGRDRWREVKGEPTDVESSTVDPSERERLQESAAEGRERARDREGGEREGVTGCCPLLTSVSKQ